MDWDGFQKVITERFETDYAAAGGTLPISYPGNPRNNPDDNWIRISWQSGSTPVGSLRSLSERHTIFLFAQIFGPPKQGRVILLQNAEIIGNIWRGQRYTIQNNGAGGSSNLPLNGANRIDTVAYSTLNLRNPATIPVEVENTEQEQVNVQIEGTLEVKYQGA